MIIINRFIIIGYKTTIFSDDQANAGYDNLSLVYDVIVSVCRAITGGSKTEFAEGKYSCMSEFWVGL